MIFSRYCLFLFLVHQGSDCDNPEDVFRVFQSFFFFFDTRQGKKQKILKAHFDFPEDHLGTNIRNVIINYVSSFDLFQFYTY